MDALTPNTPPTKRGVGRPRGVVPSHTRLIHAQRAAFNKRASIMAGKILNAQAISALGTHHMIVISFDEEGKRHTNIVRDIKRQETLLETGEYGKDYLIIEGTPADWRAGDAILNRAWGKPKETLELDVGVTFSLRALHQTSLTAPEKRSAIDITDAEPLADNGSTEPQLDHE